jgi:cysteine desulfurase
MLSHIINVHVEGVRSDALIKALDREGFYISNGAACGSAAADPSHVLLAMGLLPDEALSSVRISLGRWNIKEEIDVFLDIIPFVVAGLRSRSWKGVR